MARQDKLYLPGGSPIGFFNPVILRVIVDILPSTRTFIPESRSDFALESRILNPEPEVREVPDSEKSIDDPLPGCLRADVCCFLCCTQVFYLVASHAGV